MAADKGAEDLTAETAASPLRPGPDPTRWRELPPGTRVDRYEIVERLGAGGMGTVYRAHDPELGRDVAIKLVSAGEGEGDSQGQARLLREAQALAQLAHPNVIAVHDVGRFEGSVFLAMELVQGVNLEVWLREEARPWREVVRVFREAGQGLAAAHHAGLVHRDFKPQNVMIGGDGRVRVLDFGLARSSASSTGPLDEPISSGDMRAPGASVERVITGELAGESQTPTSKGGTLLDASVTQIGSLIGTPPYMSPEQHHGRVGDERSDQFSFCVSLYQALYGERPFAGRVRRELLENIEAGRLRSPPAGVRVPRFLRAALVRGLDKDPERRWPSMSALLAGLDQDPTRRWLLAGSALVAAALVAGVGFAIARRAPAVDPCAGSREQLAGIWDADRKARVASAFTATGKPFAADAFKAVERALDGYAEKWVGARTATCQATLREHTQSSELFDLRMSCLERHKAELKAQVDVFLAADAEVVERAPAAALALGGLKECDDAAALRSAMPPPADPKARQRVEVARGELAHVRALLESGRYADALPRAAAVTTEARALAYRPLEAEALYYLGRLQEATAEYAAAAASFREAGVAAEAARNDEFAARAWIFLMWVTGARLGKFEDAHRLADEAKAKIDRIDDDVLEAEYLLSLGTIYGDEGKYEQALDATARGLAINEKLLDPLDPALAAARSDLGDVLMQLGKYEQALSTYQQALTALDKAVGPDHPKSIATMINLAVALRRLGRHDEAVAQYRRAQALAERVLGPEYPSIATIAISLGSIATEQGKYDEANRHFEKALAIWSKRLGPEHANVGTVHFYLGDGWLKQGKPDQALAEFDQAAAIWSKALGADHPSVAVVRAAMGDARRARGELALARQSYTAALAVLEKAVGPEHPELTRGLIGLGLAELEAGNPGKAVAILERARKVASTADGDPLERAHAEFALARALRAAKGDPGRILSLATSARATYASRPAAATPLEAVDRFLAAK